MEDTDDDDSRKPAAVDPHLLAQAAEASSDDHYQPDPQFLEQQMAMDMIRFTHEVMQATTTDDIVRYLTEGYNNRPSDPGYFLGLSHGQIVILYGLTTCSQEGNQWNNRTVAFVSAFTPIPLMAITQDIDGCAFARVIELPALANLTQIRQAVNDPVHHGQSLIIPQFPPEKANQVFKAVSLIKIPTALLATASDHQATTFSLLLHLLETVTNWTTNHGTMFNNPPATLKVAETLTIIGNSLKALLTAPTGAGATTDDPTRPTGAAAMDLQLQYMELDPNSSNNNWAIKHLHHITGYVPLSELPLNDDIWVLHILPFVGMGNYAFVAGVNKLMRCFYMRFCYNCYCNNVENPRRIRTGDITKTAMVTDTFYGAVFSSIACAEFWDSHTNKQEGYVNDTDVCRLIAKTGNLELLKWAREKRFPWNETTCSNAAEKGHLEILKYARENGCPWDKTTCSGAAGNGQLELLKWARANGCPWDKTTCSGAAGNGQLELLKWARANGCPWDGDICEEAGRNEHFETVKWAHENGCPWDERDCWCAALHGHLEFLKFARANDCPWDVQTCAEAAFGGHLQLLEWARREGCPWDEQTCAYAAARGHFHIAEWAHENGCPWDERTCFCAAAHGGLEFLKYARADGCPWDEMTCSGAARHGNLELLKWARENGCPWDDETCADAAERGEFDILKWAHENGCPWSEKTTGRAQRAGHTHILEWAIENGCPSAIDDGVNWIEQREEAIQNYIRPEN